MLIALNNRKRDTNGEPIVVNTDHIVRLEVRGDKTLVFLSTREFLYVDETPLEIQKKATGAPV